MYVCMYVYLPFAKFLLCVLYYLILNSNASEVVFYVQRVVQTERFVCVLFEVGPEMLHLLRYATPLCNNICVAQQRSARLCEM